MSRLRRLILKSLICFTNGFDVLRYVNVLFNEFESTMNVLLFSKLVAAFQHARTWSSSIEINKQIQQVMKYGMVGEGRCILPN